MKCRFCGVEIHRRPERDYTTSPGFLNKKMDNPVTEAWGGGGRSGVMLVCSPDGRVWHEPMIDVDEMAATLRAIEVDLR